MQVVVKRSDIIVFSAEAAGAVIGSTVESDMLISRGIHVDESCSCSIVLVDDEFVVELRFQNMRWDGLDQHSETIMSRTLNVVLFIKIVLGGRVFSYHALELLTCRVTTRQL